MSLQYGLYHIIRASVKFLNEIPRFLHFFPGAEGLSSGATRCIILVVRLDKEFKESYKISFLEI